MNALNHLYTAHVHISYLYRMTIFDLMFLVSTKKKMNWYFSSVVYFSQEAAVHFICFIGNQFSFDLLFYTKRRLTK